MVDASYWKSIPAIFSAVCCGSLTAPPAAIECVMRLTGCRKKQTTTLCDTCTCEIKTEGHQSSNLYLLHPFDDASLGQLIGLHKLALAPKSVKK